MRLENNAQAAYAAGVAAAAAVAKEKGNVKLPASEDPPIP